MIVLLLGGAYLQVALIIVSLIGMFEFFRAYKIDSLPMKILGYIGAIIFYMMIIWDKISYLQEFFGIFMLILLIGYVFTYPKYDLKDIMLVLIGFFYVAYLLSYILMVREDPTYGPWLIWLIFIVAFGSDTCAYFIGVKFGKNKLARHLSPKKSVEGSIAGIIGATLLSVLYGVILYQTGHITDSAKIIPFFFIGGIGSVLSQIGDLAASAMKRQNKIKDFGSIMPGHGGVLDRLDSIIFTAPFVYYIMKFFIL